MDGDVQMAGEPVEAGRAAVKMAKRKQSWEGQYMIADAFTLPHWLKHVPSLSADKISEEDMAAKVTLYPIVVTFSPEGSIIPFRQSKLDDVVVVNNGPPVQSASNHTDKESKTFAFLSPEPVPKDLPPLPHVSLPHDPTQTYTAHFWTAGQRGIAVLQLRRKTYRYMLRYTERMHAFLAAERANALEQQKSQGAATREVDFYYFGLLPYHSPAGNDELAVDWVAAKAFVEEPAKWPSLHHRLVSMQKYLPKPSGDAPPGENAQALAMEHYLATLVTYHEATKDPFYPVFIDYAQTATSVTMSSLEDGSFKRGQNLPHDPETYLSRLAARAPQVAAAVQHPDAPLVCGQTFAVLNGYRLPAGEEEHAPVAIAQSPEAAFRPLPSSALKDSNRRRNFIQEAVTIVPMSRKVMQCYQLMPFLFHHVNRSVLLGEMRQRVLMHDEKPVISLSTLNHALLPPKLCPTGLDYNTYEFLGDAVLKLCITVQLFASRQYADEGQLTAARLRLITNNALTRSSAKLGLLRYCYRTPFSPKLWQIPLSTVSTKAYERTEVTHRPLSLPKNSKQRADIVESIAGAIAADEFRSGAGLSLTGPAVHFLYRALNIRVSLAETIALYDAHIKTEPHKLSDTMKANFLRPAMALAVTLRYPFRYPHLLIQALTHTTSAVIFDPPAQYQMLEFLGDAVLDYFVNEYICLSPATSEFSVGMLSTLKQSICSNYTFALLAIKLGLPQYLVHSSATLVYEVETFIARMGGLDVVRNMSAEAYRSQFILTKGGDGIIYHPPKVLADLFEAVVGALLIDTQFDYVRLRNILLPLLKDILDASIVVATGEPPQCSMRYWDKAVNTFGLDVQYHYERMSGSSFKCCVKSGEMLLATGFSDSRHGAKKAAVTVAGQKLKAGEFETSLVDSRRFWAKSSTPRKKTAEAPIVIDDASDSVVTVMPNGTLPIDVDEIVIPIEENKMRQKRSIEEVDEEEEEGAPPAAIKKQKQSREHSSVKERKKTKKRNNTGQPNGTASTKQKNKKKRPKTK